MGNLDLNIADHLIMMVLLFGLPAMSLLAPRKPFEHMDVSSALKKSLYVNNSLIQWGATVLILVIWALSGRSWTTLGLALHRSDSHFLWIILMGGFVILYFVDTLYRLYGPGQRAQTISRWRKVMPFIPANSMEFRWWILAALSAGVCEEIIFRGFMINYLLTIFSSSGHALFYAIVIPAIVFGIAHIYQGVTAVIKIVMMALAFGMIFILTESILSLIIAHSAIDLIGGLIGVYLGRDLSSPYLVSTEEE